MNSRNRTLFYGHVGKTGLKLSLTHHLYNTVLDTGTHSVATPAFMEEDLYPFYS